ncbi:FK506-binding protein 2-like [Argonauta hians]
MLHLSTPRYSMVGIIALCLTLTCFLIFSPILCNAGGTGKKKAAKQSKSLTITVEYKPETCEEVADNGDQVFVHYTGYLETGEIFDSSIKQNKNPVEFILGEAMVIPGWEQGVKGMCVGEKRKLLIPPHLAYGKSGRPPVIPPDATLRFETLLVKVIKSKPKTPEVEKRFFQLLQFFTIPALVVYVVYSLYKKYQSETEKMKEKKERKKKR